MKRQSSKVLQVQAPETGKAALKALGGSPIDEFNNIVANQVIASLWQHSNEEMRQQQYQAALTAMMGIKPADEIEGMMAAQMVATHEAAMECFRRAMLGEQSFEGRRENLNQANKLVRSYATLIEALNRHRGKGQQRVTVEHVHVHQGGQAIVGAIQGGGVSGQSEGQPDASRAITHEPCTPMWGSDPQRDAVPVAGGARQAPL